MFKILLTVIGIAFVIMQISSGEWFGRKNHGGVMQANALENQESYATAVFAGGCFWCMESTFEDTPGVIDVVSGYTGGNDAGPNYNTVSSGKTGHFEAVQITYDPAQVSYPKLLTIFGENIDPLDGDGQFADRGTQYRTAVFYQDSLQHMQARSWLNAISKKLHPHEPKILLLPGASFYSAEDEHQDYHRKHPGAYQRYVVGSGRYEKLKKSPLRTPPHNE